MNSLLPDVFSTKTHKSDLLILVAAVQHRMQSFLMSCFQKAYSATSFIYSRMLAAAPHAGC
jgi:hypothetical protein